MIWNSGPKCDFMLERSWKNRWTPVCSGWFTSPDSATDSKEFRTKLGDLVFLSFEVSTLKSKPNQIIWLAISAYIGNEWHQTNKRSVPTTSNQIADLTEHIHQWWSRPEKDVYKNGPQTLAVSLGCLLTQELKRFRLCTKNLEQRVKHVYIYIYTVNKYINI